MDNEMNNAIIEMIEAAKADYAKFGWRPEMIEKYNNSFSIRPGKKYIKIIHESSVWGFIVNVDDDKKFRKGDILKAAGFSTPARNSARGNVLDGGYEVEWTGPKYLK